MIKNPSKQELENRIARLFQVLAGPGLQFDTAIIIDKVNQYYLTGTMQDGLLVLRRDGCATYFVRKSYSRAVLESPLDIMRKMTSYQDMTAALPANLGRTFLETEIMPLVVLHRLKKYFAIEDVQPLDPVIRNLRAVKSAYELGIMAESGRQHRLLLENIVPEILREGMSETDFLADLYGRMVKLGYHGVSRFSMFQTEMVAGQLGFGESSVFPTSFNGPGGMRGQSPAVPIIGSRERRLAKGDLVFVDIGYGVLGYHSDKTQVYSFGVKPDPAVAQIHQACLDVLCFMEKRLLAGNRAADIYQETMNSLPAELSENFMGIKGEHVKFLGHGVGLYIDELPVIARDSAAVLENSMVVALEPKFAIKGVGTVGAEETYVITAQGPVCLTGGAREILTVQP